jgi:plastocyanin
LKTKLAVLFALLVLAPFAVAACGDDDDDDTDAPATEATEPSGDDADTGGDEGGSTVSFTADPGGELAFEEDSATAQAGSVTLELTNDSSVPHDVRIEASGEDVGGTEEVTEGATEAQVDLEAGDFTFYCSVPGHREAGMEGTLTVE